MHFYFQIRNFIKLFINLPYKVIYSFRMDNNVLKIARHLSLRKVLFAHEIDDELCLELLDIDIERAKLLKYIDLFELKEKLASHEENKSSPDGTTITSLCVQNDRTNKVLKVLVLTRIDHQEPDVQAWHASFDEYSQHDYFFWDPTANNTTHFKYSMDTFDVVVVHHTICILFPYNLSDFFSKLLINFKGLKVLFIQDEYQWVNRMVNKIEYLGFHVMISSLLPENIKKVYTHFGLRHVKKYSSLPGYIAEKVLNTDLISLSDRKIDVGYRGRCLGFELGRQAQEKHEIACQFCDYASRYQLRCDIDTQESSRFALDDWYHFIGSCRAVLGVEGGASIFDFDGRVSFNVKEFLIRNKNATFEEVYASYLHQVEGNVIHRVITPRIFEAICLKTALILYPGHYNGLLDPWKDYIPFERDGSNVEQVIKFLKNDDCLLELTERVYAKIALNSRYHYKTFVQKMDAIYLEEFSKLKENSYLATSVDSILMQIN